MIQIVYFIVLIIMGMMLLTLKRRNLALQNELIRKKENEKSNVSTPSPITYYKLPEKLGIKKGMELETLVDALENAIDPNYFEQVRDRVINKGNIQEEEYDYYLQELKRFFILSATVKNAPIFNEKVDEIWHEMLMFTKDYQNFCYNFIGHMVHHQPSKKKTNVPYKRAWFDWLYHQFFDISDLNKETYHSFFKHPMDKQIIKDFENENITTLENKYYQTKNQIAKRVIGRSISDTKANFKNARRAKPRKDYTRDENDDLFLSYVMIYSSMDIEDISEYDYLYDSIVNDESSSQTSSYTSSSYSSCSSCSSSSSGSTCSSCSSCGGD